MIPNTRSALYLSLVLGALPEYGVGATRESIHAEIGVGAKSSLIGALQILKERGLCRSELRDGTRRYWRAGGEANA